MRWLLALVLLAACGAPDVRVVPDAAPIDAAANELCATCDPATDFCLGPVTVAAPRLVDDDCRTLPPSCDACDCVLASLTTGTCPFATCAIDTRGLLVVKCGGGP